LTVSAPIEPPRLPLVPAAVFDLENAAIHAVPEAEPLENLPGIGDTAD
jgi:hypothetical protein